MFSSYLEIIHSNWIATASLIAGFCIGYAFKLFGFKQSNHLDDAHEKPQWLEQFIEPAIVLDLETNVINSNAAFSTIMDNCTGPFKVSTLFPGFHYRPNKILQGPAQLINTDDEAWLILTATLQTGSSLIRLIPTSHEWTQGLIEQSSTDHLQILREILTNLAHAIEQPLTHTIDAAKKLETVHNLDLPRSQFLLNALELNQKALQSYFDRYSFQQSLSQLLSAIDDIQTLATEIKPQAQESVLTGKIFSFKEAFNDAAISINSTSAASTLITHGIQPVIYMDELDQDLQLTGTKQIFIDSMVAIYNLITQPFDHKTHVDLPNVPSLSCNISLNHETEHLIVKFYEVSTHNWLAAYRKQYSTDMLTHSCQITIRGIIGLIKLHSSFQMIYSTEYLTSSTSTLKLSFPINRALNKQHEPGNSVLFGGRINGSESHELLETLSKDIEPQLNDKKNFTIH